MRTRLIHTTVMFCLTLFFVSNSVLAREECTSCGGQSSSSGSFFSSDKPDLKKVIPELQKKAAAGDAHSKALLGTYYERGIGVEQSMAKALSLYQEAHEAGAPVGTALLAWAYEDGVDVNNDGVAELWPDMEKSKAMKAQVFPLLQTIASGQNDKKGDAEAQYIVGRYYQLGLGGVAKDIGKAKEWFKKAANQGSAMGQNRLGRILIDSKDYDEACSLYRSSAEQGYGESENGLGWCYDAGKGVSRDYKKAREWYKKADENGAFWAAYNLGLHYFSTLQKGIPLDLKKSTAYYRRAVKLGNENAYHYLGKRSICSVCDPLNASVLFAWRLTYNPNKKDSLEELTKLKNHKNLKRIDHFPLKPGGYNREKLLSLLEDAQKGVEGAVRVVKDWKAMGWVNGNDLATLDWFTDRKNVNNQEPFLISKFMNNGRSLLTATTEKYAKYDSQGFIAQWDVESKELRRLVALEPETKIHAISADGKRVLVQSSEVASFNQIGRGENRPERLALHGTLNGRVDKVLMESGTGYYSYAGFGPSGRFVHVRHNPSGDKKSKTYVWEVASGKLKKTYDAKYVDINYSPDGNKFYISLSGDGEPVSKVGETSNWAGNTIGKSKNMAIFSSDSRYLVTDQRLYDATTGRNIGKCTLSSSDSTAFNGKNSFASANYSSFSVVSIRDEKCITVVPGKKIGENLRFLKSPPVLTDDNTQAAIISDTKDEKYSVNIVAIPKPDEKAIAAKIAKEKKASEFSAKLKEVKELLDADFLDEGLGKAKSYITEAPHINGFTSLLFKNRQKYGMAPAGQIILHRIKALLATPKSGKLGVYLEGENGEAKIKYFTTAGSRLEKAGLQAGDVIVSIDGYPVRKPWPEDSWAYWKKVKPEQTIHIKYLRGQEAKEARVKAYGSIEQNHARFKMVLQEYVRFGAMAINSGHPGIGRQTIKRLKQLAKPHPFDAKNNGIDYPHSIAVLAALELASTGKSKEAYALLLKEKYMKDRYVSEGARYIINYPDLFAPLYINPKKLAYLIGKKESDLAATPETFFQPQAFPDINGKMIAKGKTIGTQKPTKKKVKNKPKPKAKPKKKTPTVKVLDD